MTKTICDRCDQAIEGRVYNDHILPIARLIASRPDIVDSLRKDLCGKCFERLAFKIAKVLLNHE